MDPDLPSILIADVVRSLAGRDAGKLFYVIATDGTWLTLVNGKDRTLETPKRKKQKQSQKSAFHRYLLSFVIGDKGGFAALLNLNFILTT